jgi:hypothetical protein
MVIPCRAPVRESRSAVARYEPVRAGYASDVRGSVIIDPAVGGASVAVVAAGGTRGAAFSMSDRDCRSGASTIEVSDLCLSVTR